MIVIDAPHFYAAVAVRDGVVVKAAPIVAWMIGKSVARVLSYCRQKGWRAEVRDDKTKRLPV